MRRRKIKNDDFVPDKPKRCQCMNQTQLTIYVPGPDPDALKLWIQKVRNAII